MTEQEGLARRPNIEGRFPKLKEIPENRYPNHLLIIPDGNGRWAQKANQIPIFGHRQGFKTLKGMFGDLQQLPIKFISVWTFAADNWKRSQEEINDLMNLSEEGLTEILPDLVRTNIRFIHLGRKDRIPLTLKTAIQHAENITRNNKDKTLCLLIDFGGEDQELRIMEKVHKFPQATEITHELLRQLRDGQGEIPPADLIIRTSNEQRTSDIGWLGINAELYFIKKLLPDTTTQDYVEGIIDYSKRERRFGARPQKES